MFFSCWSEQFWENFGKIETQPWKPNPMTHPMPTVDLKVGVQTVSSNPSDGSGWEDSPPKWIGSSGGLTSNRIVLNPGTPLYLILLLYPVGLLWKSRAHLGWLFLFGLQLWGRSGQLIISLEGTWWCWTGVVCAKKMGKRWTIFCFIAPMLERFGLWFWIYLGSAG